MSEFQAAPFVPGSASGILQRGPSKASNHSILLLTQPDIARLDKHPAGIVVVDGAPLSHPMIRLLTLGIPSVMVTSETACKLEPGVEIFIDGFQGKIFQPPPPDWEAKRPPEPPPPGKPISLADGSEVRLGASIFSIENAAHAIQQGAAAIGLVRTEFLVPEDGSLPDTAFYQSTLTRLCETARPLAITLRLPDITPDKPARWLEQEASMTGHLGLQGVRLYKHEPVQTVLFAMLDAVSRLSRDYALSLLLPYVTQLEEFRDWRSKIEQRTGSTLPIGTMAETPAAVLAMPHWFDVADFVAIGCNDLMQCLFAADRDLAEVNSYLDPYSPELFRFLQQSAVMAGDNINKVQLCGLLPQLPGVLPILLGMGFRTFSVAPVMIPYLAKSVRETNPDEAKALAQQVCMVADSRQVRELL